MTQNRPALTIVETVTVLAAAAVALAILLPALAHARVTGQDGYSQGKLEWVNVTGQVCPLMAH